MDCASMGDGRMDGFIFVPIPIEMELALLGISWAIILAGNVASFYAGKMTTKGTGHDLGYAVIPRMDVSPFILNLVLTLSFVPLLLHPNKEAFWAFVTYYTIIMLVRAVTTNLTLLPEDKHCPYDEMTLETMLQGHCSDKLFSGHQALVATLGIVYVQYGIVTAPVALGYNALLAYLLLASRSHYTADIFLGATLPYLLILKSF